MKFSSTSRLAVSLAAINGFLVVSIGAFGAHLLEEIIGPEMLQTYNTGVHYHMFHVAGLIAAAFLGLQDESSTMLKFSIGCFLAGILLFSGSLYLLAVTGYRMLGMVTPFGGLAFLSAWVLLFLVARKIP